MESLQNRTKLWSHKNGKLTRNTSELSSLYALGAYKDIEKSKYYVKRFNAEPIKFLLATKISSFRMLVRTSIDYYLLVSHAFKIRLTFSFLFFIAAKDYN